MAWRHPQTVASLAINADSTINFNLDLPSLLISLYQCVSTLSDLPTHPGRQHLRKLNILLNGVPVMYVLLRMCLVDLHHLS